MEQRNVLLIASASWDSPTKVNVHFIAENLAKDGNRVLFIESLGLRSPQVAKSDFQKVARRVVNFLKGPRFVSKGIYVLSPILIPFQRFALIRKINELWLTLYIRFIQEVLRFSSPLLWMFLPTGSFLIHRLGEKLRIYHCVDDYASNPGVDSGYIRTLENELLAHVDVVFATAAALYERFSTLHQNVAYLPNVANYEFFSQAQGDTLPVAPELVNIPRPILGYWGNLADYKIDWQLLYDLACARPHWTICLIGPIGFGDPETNIEKIKSLQNVVLLGAKPFDTLPNFAKGFDVCILPSNTRLAGSFPMKFYEYLATGKPVVATSQPSIVKEYEGKEAPCKFANTADEFIVAIEEILLDPSYNKEYRLAEAYEHSWEKRMLDIYRLVKAGLAAKK